MCPGTPICDFVQLSDAYVTCDYRTESYEACGARATQLIANVKQYFEDRHSEYSRKKPACIDASADLDEKKKLYDSARLVYTLNMEQLNVLVSNYNREIGRIKASDDAICAAWARCHDDASVAYKRITDLTLSRVANRKREFVAASTISCMLTSFLNGGAFDDTTMRACNDSVSLSMHLDIIKPSSPPAPSINSSSDPLCFASGTEEMDNLTARAPPELPVYARCGAELDAPPQVFTPPECGISGNVVCVKRESDSR